MIWAIGRGLVYLIAGSMVAAGLSLSYTVPAPGLAWCIAGIGLVLIFHTAGNAHFAKAPREPHEFEVAATVKMVVQARTLEEAEALRDAALAADKMPRHVKVKGVTLNAPAPAPAPKKGK